MKNIKKVFRQVAFYAFIAVASFMLWKSVPTTFNNMVNTATITTDYVKGAVSEFTERLQHASIRKHYRVDYSYPTIFTVHDSEIVEYDAPAKYWIPAEYSTRYVLTISETGTLDEDKVFKQIAVDKATYEKYSVANIISLYDDKDEVLLVNDNVYLLFDVIDDDINYFDL